MSHYFSGGHRLNNVVLARRTFISEISSKFGHFVQKVIMRNKKLLSPSVHKNVGFITLNTTAALFMGELFTCCSSISPRTVMNDNLASIEDEDSVREETSEGSISGDLNSTITIFNNLEVEAYIANNKKRNRIPETTLVNSPIPPKKHCPIMNKWPPLADVVKTDKEGYMVDIVSAEDKPPLTKEQNDAVQRNITVALFSKEDISKIKFETPYFDGGKLRIICKN